MVPFAAAQIACCPPSDVVPLEDLRLTCPEAQIRDQRQPFPAHLPMVPAQEYLDLRNGEPDPCRLAESVEG